MCAYHTETIAVDKCERCQRPICLVGKKVYHKRHSSGTGSHRTRWTTTHTYCPPCYADVATDAASGPGAIFGSIFFIIVAIFITVGFFSFGGPLGIIPLLFIVFAVYQFKERARLAEEARQDEKRFLNSLNNKPTGITQNTDYSSFKGYTRPDKAWKVSDVSCFNCGDAIELNANYCMNCGDSTKDEKKYHKIS